MIEVIDIHKRYYTDHGMGPWVLQGVNLCIPNGLSVGLVGGNGAGKSTLLRIIGGVDYPSKGAVRRHCKVSWPMGFGGGLQGSMTGRQNTKFVARIHGMEHDIPRILSQVQQFAEIGSAFDEPIKTYSSGMKSRLQFGLSLAFDFDVYISDEITAAGDRSFQAKASKAFKDKVGKASVIMVSHSEATLKDFCQAGVWLHRGQAHWFDQIDDALRAYHDSTSVSTS
ncbi:ABC transporter ATP-binding protein [Comamonas sp. 17RB]|uniref:ABC transporter ATP-binding protein n=1 Tax=Comamonas sp. 17RB TaxID=3047025 RepID=UPI0024B876A6|nr:ABC transporter ATP-binding protein [Comamonas sp. 17RB]MDI9855077.1 ABC transporter ATP-binding protein [Comamonas sp. 17RB]